ncbi:FKBP-type peptidyl-prolyl cis-trans isomerase [Metschnikowia aff. pulcherrima]|uniref:peptidylprolyl isomerase n=1 Tax=Metschnikowia aff. pulcherrima TaxID=2163413 RepID=A0A4P6XQ33_9ASCO|nr:FKBP-type peptidyl-prolyl cis-trans isomerase [Metschnikowia aff. pulcherrima]
MVIPGWEQGILGMCIGEQRTLNIPAELGYGSRAIGPIPANSDLGMLRFSFFFLESDMALYYRCVVSWLHVTV